MASASVSWPSRVKVGSRFAVTFHISLDRRAVVNYGALVGGRGTEREGTYDPGDYTKYIYLTAPSYPGTYEVWAYVKVNGEKILDRKGSITVYSPTPTPQPSVTIKSAPSSVKPGDYVTIAIATSNISGSYYVDAWLKDASGRSVLYARKSLSGPVAWAEISLGTVPSDVSPGTGKIEVKLVQSGRTVASTSKSVTIGAIQTMKKVSFVDVLLPGEIQVGVPAEFVAVFDNPNSSNVTVKLDIYVNGNFYGSVTGSVQPGRHTVPFAIKFNAPGTYTVEVVAYMGG